MPEQTSQLISSGGPQRLVRSFWLRVIVLIGVVLVVQMFEGSLWRAPVTSIVPTSGRRGEAAHRETGARNCAGRIGVSHRKLTIGPSDRGGWRLRRAKGED